MQLYNIDKRTNTEKHIEPDGSFRQKTCFERLEVEKNDYVSCMA